MPETDDLVRGYAQGLFNVLRAEGKLDRVEDELYRFGKLLEANHELKQALSDPGIERERRTQMVSELLSGKVTDATMGMVTFIVSQNRARQLPQILSEVSALAAQARDAVVAEVRSAVPLGDDQRQRLAESLARATGKRVEVKVVIDPAIIGGISAKVGDTVIDGSIKHRLEQLKQEMKAG